MKRQKLLVAVVLALVFLVVPPALAGFFKKEGDSKKDRGGKHEPAVKIERPSQMNPFRPRESFRRSDENVGIERGKSPRGNESGVPERPSWGKRRESIPSQQPPVFQEERRRNTEFRGRQDSTFERPRWERSKNPPPESKRLNPERPSPWGQRRETKLEKRGFGQINTQSNPGWDHSRPMPGLRHPIPSSPTIDHRRIPSERIAGARVIDRTNIRQLRPSYGQVVRQFGRPPSHRYAFEPRRIYTRGFRRSQFRDRVALSFYFGYYHSEPEWVGLYHRGYYPAVYVLWGWCPGWILPARVHYTVFDYLDRRPALRDYEGVDEAIDDLQTAWTDGDLELITNHLTDDVRVRIYFNGKYSYSLAIEDFRQMTADALASTKTTAIRFNQPIWLAPREVFISGHQLFLDPEGGEHQMYLSYRLRRLGSNWYIVSFGSSDEPIVSPR